MNGYFSAEVRFAARYVEDENGCWIWTGRLTPDGYADRIAVKNVRYRPTHYALLAFRDIVVPVGMHADHLCRVRACVNPWHLEVVPPGTNNQRAYDARDACRNGHPKATTDAYEGRGRRECQQCRREATARYQAKCH